MWDVYSVLMSVEYINMNCVRLPVINEVTENMLHCLVEVNVLFKKILKERKTRNKNRITESDIFVSVKSSAHSICLNSYTTIAFILQLKLCFTKSNVKFTTKYAPKIKETPNHTFPLCFQIIHHYL